MSADHGKNRRRSKARALIREARFEPSSDDAHQIVFFRRYKIDDPEEAEPGRSALQSWPGSVRVKARARLVAVAAAPPKRFAGGGYWEAMRGELTGWFELRVDGPDRHHYRLYCRLDYDAKGMDKPLLVVIDGRDKPFRTELSASDYRAVRRFGEEYLSHNPRSLAVP